MSKLSSDQQFARYVKVSIALFAIFFSYFIFADLYIPMTPQARVYHQVTKVTPQVSGEVITVHVSNNQRVTQGELLLTIDPTPYQLAFTQAKLKLAEVNQKNQQLDAQITAMEAQIDAAVAKRDEQQRLYKRSQSLLSQHSISPQESDQIQANYTAAKSQLSALRANLSALALQRGATDDNNIALQQALNAVEQAKLQLSYTQIRAPHDGIVSNLQITAGTYARAGISLTGLVSDNLDLAADFREKSLYHVRPGEQALVSFDALPGKVYPAVINEFSAGVSDGQLDANGQLARVETSNRWVRDAQRQRVHLAFNEPLPLLASGARATVQVMPQSSWLATLAQAQIKFVSFLHYVY
ncbi:HlyD family secretion protein [Pseudoalteromonas piscicida]|uniref:Hemolysin D n=1 Tax=Pseudoalteromonas piscicida TaxID=43662 RepID=A0A2A5JLK5_PSEO7|nr:HlyD family secretion protein [Pseudoalteromonas piscicida]PCK30333.1 hemolysin D [Pseudoalteromonas piscicida]